jgi:hypothetical protein
MDSKQQFVQELKTRVLPFHGTTIIECGKRVKGTF